AESLRAADDRARSIALQETACRERTENEGSDQAIWEAGYRRQGFRSCDELRGSMRKNSGVRPRCILTVFKRANLVPPSPAEWIARSVNRAVTPGKTPSETPLMKGFLTSNS